MKLRILLEQKTKLKEEAAAILAKADEEERHLKDEEKTRLKEIEAGLDQIEEDLAIREKFRTMDLSKTDNIHDLGDGNGDGVQKPEEPVFKGDYALGEFCCAVARYYTSGGLDFDPKLKAAAAGLSSDVPSAGGFGVQQDMSAELWKRAYDVGGILSRVRRVRVGANSDGLKSNAIDESSRATGSRFGGVVGYWLSQGDAITASKPNAAAARDTSSDRRGCPSGLVVSHLTSPVNSVSRPMVFTTAPSRLRPGTETAIG